MSYIKLAKSDGLTHRMIVPMTNIVISWETIIEAVIEASNEVHNDVRDVFYLQLEPSGLHEGVYELKPVGRKTTMFKLDVIETPNVLQFPEPDDSTLQLQIRVYDNDGEILAGFRARQPYDDKAWYNFERKFSKKKASKVGRGSKAVANLEARQQQAVASLAKRANRTKIFNKAVERMKTLHAKVYAAPNFVGNSVGNPNPVGDYVDVPVDAADFRSSLDCALGIARDGTELYRRDGQQLPGLYDRMMLIEGPEFERVNFKAFKALYMHTVRRNALLAKDPSTWKKSSFNAQAWRQSFEDPPKTDMERMEMLFWDLYLWDQVPADAKKPRKRDIVFRYNIFFVNQNVKAGMDRARINQVLKDAEPLMKREQKQRVAMEIVRKGLQFEDLVHGRPSSDWLRGPAWSVPPKFAWLVSNSLGSENSLTQYYGMGQRHLWYSSAFDDKQAAFRDQCKYVDGLITMLYTCEAQQFLDRANIINVTKPVGQPQDLPNFDLFPTYSKLFPTCAKVKNDPTVADLIKRLRELSPARYAKLLTRRNLIESTVKDCAEGYVYKTKEERTAFDKQLELIGVDAALLLDRKDKDVVEYIKQRSRDEADDMKIEALPGTDELRLGADDEGFEEGFEAGFEEELVPIPSPKPTVETTLNLLKTLPLTEALWDWEPSNKQIIESLNGQETWVVYVRDGVRTTVIWQEIRHDRIFWARCKAQRMMLNDQRVESGNTEGPAILQTFTGELGKQLYFGFQTRESTYVVDDVDDRMEDDDGTDDFLLQDGTRLRYNFRIPPEECSRTEEPKVPWTLRSIDDGPCNETNTAWQQYSMCRMSAEFQESILNVSFKYPTVDQKRTVSSFLEQANESNHCLNMSILLNYKLSSRHQAFHFLSSDQRSCAWRDVTPSKVCKWIKHNTADSSALHPQREFEKMQQFENLGIGLAVERCQESFENQALSRLKFDVSYIPELGDQYWTIVMGEAQMTLRHYLQCMRKGRDAANIVTASITGILNVMQENSLWHGRFDLRSLLVVSLDPFELKVMNVEYSFKKKDALYTDVQTLLDDCAQLRASLLDDDKIRVLTYMEDQLTLYKRDEVVVPATTLRLEMQQQDVRQRGDAWCERYGLTAPSDLFDHMSAFQRVALDSSGQSKKKQKTNKKTSPQSHKLVLPTDGQNIFPASLQNSGTSCYFNSAVLFLYQMKDALTNVQCSDQDKEKESTSNNVITEIKSLMADMGRIKDSVDIYRSKKVTELSRSLLKDDFGQQDGAEFLKRIFNCIDEIKDNTFTTELLIEQRRSSRQVRKLDCNDEPVPQRAVDAFDIKWQLSRNTGNKQPLSEYTYDKEKDTIRLMTQGDDRNRHIFRGQPKDTDPDLQKIDWRAVDVTDIKERSSHFIELSTLHRPGQSVCGHIEDDLLNPVGDIKGTTRDAANDLFFFYTLETRKYQPTSKYAIVSFSRTRWQENSQADDFNYAQQSFTVGDQTYELIAVIHRTGDGTQCGH